ncbi:GTP pyrophosphokinase [Paenibacillus turpanensis]|uniref:GTP pyrophosphokinase n=1 Tax=Paenibacillus turpanensis TaxID=2689078 RepID=UPI00140AE697|nr:GTP pyrophosphokinase family protein [Paenibacillus turpanensis]
MSMNQLEQLKRIRNSLTRFMMMYKFALQEVETKIDILQEEFQFLHDYNPIEHTKSRIKTPESIMKKLYRKGGVGSLEEIREHIKDIAGIRITCSFVSDIYYISRMLQNQNDLQVVSIKDYIKNPKPNGYKSLHLLVKVPVFMSDRQESVYVEVQIRTIAMDFWASLEHKIFYKFNGTVPQRFLNELKEAADSANELDEKMERLHSEISQIKTDQSSNQGLDSALFGGNVKLPIPNQLLSLLSEEEK